MTLLTFTTFGSLLFWGGAPLRCRSTRSTGHVHKDTSCLCVPIPYQNKTKNVTNSNIQSPLLLLYQPLIESATEKYTICLNVSFLRSVCNNIKESNSSLFVLLSCCTNIVIIKTKSVTNSNIWALLSFCINSLLDCNRNVYYLSKCVWPPLRLRVQQNRILFV